MHELRVGQQVLYFQLSPPLGHPVLFIVLSPGVLGIQVLPAIIASIINLIATRLYLLKAVSLKLQWQTQSVPIQSWALAIFFSKIRKYLFF